MADFDNWLTYKEPLKRFIRDFTGDDDYYRNKRKVGSLQHTCGGNLALTNAWVNIKWGAHSRIHSEMTIKYGEEFLERFCLSGLVD